MKRLLLFVCLLLMISFAAHAQMTDDQVVDYAKTQMAAGKDAKQIGKELMGRGVSIEQIERLRTKYSNSTEERTVMPTETDRSRVSNGEKRPDDFSDIKDKDEKDDTSLRKIFGHDIFRAKNLSFEPAMNIATPANYTLGPGDEVVLDIFGASQYSNSFKISPDGTITIPNEGPVNVAGLTVTQAQAKVARTIGAHYQDSQIKLTVGQTRTITVNVMGEVKTPGTYTLSAFATVFNALYLAGGVTEIGTLREIKVSRNGTIITKVDVYDYIVNGRLTGNVMLKDNDVIIVGPYANLVEVVGKIKRPMFYEMKKTESLQSLLQFAGGFTADAYKQKIRIERKSEEGLTVHNIDEWDFNSFRTEDGDVVVVSGIIERYKNTVKVTGGVFREGQYKLGGTVNSVKTLVEQAGGLLEQAVLTRAVLRRMKENRTYMTMTVNLAGIMDGTSPDVILQNEDELIVGSTVDIDKDHRIEIYGDVYTPGVYEFSEGTTIEDLIIQAGGLRESASLLNVEVARRIVSSDENPDGTKMANIYSLTLKDGLAIEGESGFKLRPYDIVSIHRSPDYQEQRVVYVTGEVNYGGAYVISNKNERISDIIKRAGGLTKSAFLDGAQVIRKMNEKEIEMQRKKLELSMNMSDSLSAKGDLEKNYYNVGVNLRNALDNPGCASDITLQANDSIYVPQLNNVVKVSGEVLLPNTVAYEEGKSANYYMSQAGGVNNQGKKSMAFIVYPNGQVNKANKGKVLPGCEIVVPKKPEKKVDSQLISLIIAAVGALSTIGAVLVSALR